MVHETNDHVYFSMEYCDGGTLWEKLRSKKFGIQESLSIAQSLIQGLQHIHNTTIEGRRALHRDIKSDNILFSNNIPKLGTDGVKSWCITTSGDFGLAKLTTESG